MLAASGSGDEVEYLTGICRVNALMSRYARGIDRGDRAMFESTLCDELEVEFPGWEGSRLMTAQQWADYCFGLVAGFDATQHLFGSSEVDLVPGSNAASCFVYFRALHYFSDRVEDSYEVGGEYIHDLRRSDAGWQIRHWRALVFWERGSSDAFRIARHRAKQTGAQ
jgi:SnoaL-like domain